jgi:6-pyruvoyltetrahydropterin/6-carboxytetrahydropterin synthase
VRDWSDSENTTAFGRESSSKYGTGRNYTAYFVFSGTPDPTTAMLINISEIKDRAGEIIDENFDHKFLNEDNAAFIDTPPTTENIARQLLRDVAPRFADTPAKLVAVHLRETPERSATVYDNGVVDANHWFSFSAARETRSPQLSDEENARLFGKAVGVHGHNYRVRLTFRRENGMTIGPLIRYNELQQCVDSLIDELDHRHLNREVPVFRERAMTTESLAFYVMERAAAALPLARLRLHERDDFFAEVFADHSVFLGMREKFSAAHRLHVAAFTEGQNDKLFGKCNNLRGHGHNYIAEATVGGAYEEGSGVLRDFVQFRRALDQAIAPWRDRHLDLETEDFRKTPSTGENIVRALWPRVDAGVDSQLVRLRLWETENNRFTLRRI